MVFSEEIIWWISVVDIPAMGALFWLIWRTRREAESAIQIMRENAETRTAQMREGLSAFKLEVARNYAARADMKELEERLVSHLLRIESKLEITALKTESLQGISQRVGIKRASRTVPSQDHHGF